MHTQKFVVTNASLKHGGHSNFPSSKAIRNTRLTQAMCKHEILCSAHAFAVSQLLCDPGTKHRHAAQPPQYKLMNVLLIIQQTAIRVMLSDHHAAKPRHCMKRKLTPNMKRMHTLLAAFALCLLLMAPPKPLADMRAAHCLLCCRFIRTHSSCLQARPYSVKTNVGVEQALCQVGGMCDELVVVYGTHVQQGRGRHVNLYGSTAFGTQRTIAAPSS